MLTIQPAPRPLHAALSVPGSKSVASRALIAAAMASGSSILSNVGFCDDIRALINGLQNLGIPITADEFGGRVEVTGLGGRLPVDEAEVDCGDSGTMLRCITALCSAAHGTFRVTGSPRCCSRPIVPLVQALQRQGAGFKCTGEVDRPPYVIQARGLAGGEIAIAGDQTSQFVTALLLSAPAARNDVFVTVTGERVSTPYVDLTCALMERFGVTVLPSEDQRRFAVFAPQVYRAGHIAVAPDASTAGYLLAAAAVRGGRTCVRNLRQATHQPDLAIADHLAHMGCTVDHSGDDVRVMRDPAVPMRGIDMDVRDLPDAVPTLAVCALFAHGRTVLRGVGHLRHKESDRLQGLVEGLAGCGAHVSATTDTLTVDPPDTPVGTTIDPRGDHRMAMAFTLVGLAVPGLTLVDATCVAKSCPEYFQLIAKLVPDP